MLAGVTEPWLGKKRQGAKQDRPKLDLWNPQPKILVMMITSPQMTWNATTDEEHLNWDSGILKKLTNVNLPPFPLTSDNGVLNHPLVF